jgi:hypothetical protein
MYTEKQPWGETKYDIFSNSHIQFRTKKQKVDLISNPHFGRMLFLDEVLQLASADEHMYHRPFAHQVMKMKEQSRILVAGGADGALLREIQDHDGKYNLGVEEIVLVDWDEELVNYLSNEEPYSRGSLDDPRLLMKYEDIQEFLERDIQPFDSIFLDLLDPKTAEDMEWTKQLLQKSVAKSVGTIGLNAGSDPILVEGLIKFCEKLGQDQVSTLGEKLGQDQVSTLGEKLGQGPVSTYKIHVEIITVPSFQEPWFLLFIEPQGVLEKNKMTPENL